MKHRAIEAIAFVRSVLTKAKSRIAPPQWGQTISPPRVRLSNSTLSTAPVDRSTEYIFYNLPISFRWL